MFLFEGLNQRKQLIQAPTQNVLAAYAGEVVRVVNLYLRALGRRHLEAMVYSQAVLQGDLAKGAPSVAAVRFSMRPGAPNKASLVHQGRESDLEQLTTLLRGQVNPDVPPYLNERRQLRIYTENDLCILKPAEARYWTRTAGINDADVILADHWMKDGNASRA